MPRKLSRPDTDVQKLAAELRKRWTPADGIAPWLRRNESKLRRMVRDEGWNWTDIGRAMTLAGITYASGTPWTGALLNVKMAQARSHLRTRDARRAGSGRSEGQRPAGILAIADPANASLVDSASEP